MIVFERPACFLWSAVLALTALAAGIASSSGELPAGNGTVFLEAEAIAESTAIELRWNPADARGSLRLRKRLPGSSWQILSNPGRTACRYTDFNVVPGTVYEYSVEVIGEDQQVDGTFLWSGIDVPVNHWRGSCLLVVEQGLAEALSEEISTFMTDLEGDGWRAGRIDVASDSAPLSASSKGFAS